MLTTNFQMRLGSLSRPTTTETNMSQSMIKEEFQWKGESENMGRTSQLIPFWRKCLLGQISTSPPSWQQWWLQESTTRMWQPGMVLTRLSFNFVSNEWFASWNILMSMMRWSKEASDTSTSERVSSAKNGGEFAASSSSDAVNLSLGVELPEVALESVSRELLLDIINDLSSVGLNLGGKFSFSFVQNIILDTLRKFFIEGKVGSLLGDVAEHGVLHMGHLSFNSLLLDVHLT